MQENGQPVGAAAIRQAILDADDVRFEDVDVPEWGVTIRVFSMSGDERARMVERNTKPDGTTDVTALYPGLLRATCFAPDGGTVPDEAARLFGEADAEWLGAKNSAALERVAQTALRMSGLDAAARAKAGKDS